MLWLMQLLVLLRSLLQLLLLRLWRLELLLRLMLLQLLLDSLKLLLQLLLPAMLLDLQLKHMTGRVHARSFRLIWSAGIAWRVGNLEAFSEAQVLLTKAWPGSMGRLLTLPQRRGCQQPWPAVTGT